MSSDDVDDSRVVEDIYVPSELASIDEDLLVNYSTPKPDDIYIHEDNTSGSEHVLMESSMSVLVVGIHLSHQ